MSYTVERLFFKSGARKGQPNGQYLVRWDDYGATREVKLPGVTTVIKAGLPEGQGMKNWRTNCGVEAACGALRLRLATGRSLTAALLAIIEKEAKAEPDRFRDEAADIGTEVHRLIENWLRLGVEPDMNGRDERVINGWTAFREWWAASGFTPIRTEFAVASLDLGCGGTVDCLALDPEFRRVLVDFKTSKSIYESHEIQAVTYARCVEDMGEEPVDRVVIGQFGKYDATFNEREVEEHLWPGHLDQFRRCLGTREWLNAATARYYARSNGRKVEVTA